MEYNDREQLRRTALFATIEHETYTFTLEDLKQLGLYEPPLTAEQEEIIASMPEEEANTCIKEIADEESQRNADIELVQKFTGDRETKFKKARAWLKAMYA